LDISYKCTLLNSAADGSALPNLVQCGNLSLDS
jgi:hypothetical protein